MELVRIGAEREYRAMQRRQRQLPEGLRHAGGLAENIKTGVADARDYFRETLGFLRASASRCKDPGK